MPLISPTFARKRQVIDASAERNTIFSQTSWSMSSDKSQSTVVAASAAASASTRARARAVTLAEDEALQRTVLLNHAVRPQ